MKTRVFVQVLSVKEIPSCGRDLHRHSRFAGFEDIFYWTSDVSVFILVVCVFCELFKCNVIAFTLHLRGGVKGIIVKGIIVIV
jgi:hypothetical protein